MTLKQLKKKYMVEGFKLGVKHARKQLNEWGGEEFIDNQPVELDVGEGSWVKFLDNGRPLYGVVTYVETETDYEYGYEEGITSISIAATNGQTYDFNVDFEIMAAKITEVDERNLPRGLAEQLMEIEQTELYEQGLEIEGTEL